MHGMVKSVALGLQERGEVTVCDFNPEMLEQGKAKPGDRRPLLPQLLLLPLLASPLINVAPCPQVNIASIGSHERN